MSNVPTPPPGFQLEQSQTPALPPGFQLEQPQTPAPPPGFEIEQPATATAGGTPPLPAGFELAETLPDASQRHWVDRFVVDPWRRGVDRAGMALNAGRVISGNMSVSDFLAAAKQHQFNQQLSPMHPDDAAAMERVSDAPGFVEAFGAAVSNPSTIAQTIVSSLPMSAPSIAGGVAGGLAGGAVSGPAAPVGGLVGGAVGAGAGSFTAEFLNSVSDALLESEGIAGEKQMAEILKDEAFMGKVYDHAMKRGMGIAAFDAVSMGLAGRVFRPVSNMVGDGAGIASRATGALAETGVQSASGAAGEAAAQLLSEGKISSPGDVVMEGLAETVMGVPEIGGAVLTRKANERPQQVETLDPADISTAAHTEVETLDPADIAGATNSDLAKPDQSTDGPEPVEPVEPVEAPVPVPSSTGRTERVITPDGQFETDVEFEIVDADSLTAAEGQLQPRDRVSRVGSGEQIATIASSLDPLRLMGSRESDRGSPIIDENGTVLSGNGRVASILLAQQSHPERYEAYVQALQAEGYDVSGVKTPVLVRRARGISPDNKRRFAVGSNTEAGLALSASERARMEQDAITPDMLAGFDNEVEGGVTAAANEGFVRQFLNNLPQSVRGSFYTADGKLSEDGARRVANAVFARAYNDPQLVARATETNADPAIRNALLGAAASWARMRDAAPDFDVTADLVAAVGLLNDARSKGMTVPSYLAQQDAFRQIPERVQALASLFLNRDSTRIAAWKDIRDRLKSYAEAGATSANAAGDLLGNRPGPDEALAQIRQGVERRGEDPPKAANSQQRRQGGGGAGAQRLAAGAVQKATPRQQMDDAMLDADEDPFFDLDDDADVFADDDTGGEGFTDTEPMEDASPSRRPRGALAPKTKDVSFTNRQSMYEQAWRDAGLTPDEGTLLKPERQRNVLRNLLRKTFGFGDVVLDAQGLRIPTIDAVNQMLDAYRNVRMMMHALGLPTKAVALGGRLTLQLERDTSRYFGAYFPLEHRIALPGRSNSFAHEWAHALDHYLGDLAAKNAHFGYMLTQVGRNGGLDMTNTLEGAFAQIINAMFYDDAALAARLMELERQAQAVHAKGANKGKPTKAALEARAQYDRLLAGGSRLKILASKFRQDSKQFDPASTYWTSVHEMFARAFEAYVAHKVDLTGGTNEFITKGEAAYLSDADTRLALTFPKLDDRVKIFAAFDHMMGVLRTQQTLGTGPVADRAQDTDILDPMHWHKLAAGQDVDGLLGASKKEFFKVTNVAKNLFNPAAWRDGLSQVALNAGINGSVVPKRVLDATLDKARFFAGTMRAYVNARISRNNGQGGEFLSFIWDRFAAQPGSKSTHIGAVFEERRAQLASRASGEIESMLRSTGMDKVFLKAKTAEKAGEIVRALMYGDGHPEATDAHKKVAAGLRRIMSRVYSDAKKAGIEMGYVEDTGYMPRILNSDKVRNDPEAFKTEAEKVYGVVFDDLVEDATPRDVAQLARETAKRARPDDPKSMFRDELKALRDALANLANAQEAAEADPRLTPDVAIAEDELAAALDALKAAVRPVFMDVSARDWTERVVSGDSVTYDAHGPATNFTKKRALPAEADQIMADFYEQDPLTSVTSYVQRVTSRQAYLEAGGKSGGTATLDQVISRPDVRREIAANRGRFNPDTSAGRMNILRHLADPATDNLIEIALKEATRAGAYGPDVIAVRDVIENIAGQRTKSSLGGMLDRAAGAAYVFTYVALLSRAAITGLTEPLTVMLRTGDLNATFKTFTAYLSEAVRTSKTVKDRAALARAIGLVSSPLYDSVLLNRLSADSAEFMSGNKLMAGFFRSNMLSQLTNAQRRATMVGGFVWMQTLAAEYKGHSNAGRKKIIEAEFRELGVEAESLPDFMDWLTQSDDLPSLDELQSKAGERFSFAVNRFTDQIIQNPRRADKPALAGTPVGAVVYALTGFLYSFFSNVHAAIVTRTQRDYMLRREAGESKGEAASAAAGAGVWTFTSGFALMLAGQMLVTMGREAIFNSEQWEKKREADELQEWLFGLALSRTGIYGPADMLMNALTGLRYERDLANLFVGTGPAYIASNVQNIIRGLPGQPRNSPNTNTAEREALKSLYRLTVGPLAASLLSAAGSAGPVTAAGSYAGLTYFTSNSAADAFATFFAGPREK